MKNNFTHPYKKKVYVGPIRFITFIILLTTLVEYLTMFYLQDLHIFPSEKFFDIFDSALMAIVLIPTLYFFLYRPMIRYITKLSKTEEALRKNEERFRNLVEATSDLVWEVDKNAVYTYVSPQVRTILGYEPEYLIGKNLFDPLLEEETERIKHISLPDITQGKPVKSFEYIKRHKDGHLVVLETRNVPSFDEVGAFIGFRGIARDITERKQDEKKLQRAYDDLEKRVAERTVELSTSNQMLKQEIIERKQAEDALARQAQELASSNAELEKFAYVASHDLQEPLRMVASYTQLLEKRYKDKLDSNADEIIYYITDGATRMRGLINDLLAFSRVGSKDKIFKLTNCQQVLENVLINLKAAIDESSMIITQDTLPLLVGDESQLVQLFQNLISNAIKFRDEKPVQIHIGVERQGPYWVFSVQDNGIGIKPEFFSRIFEIFQRLHSREQFPGNGMGLAICKKIVERHGGRIWVDSELRKGSTFFFTIPVSGELRAGKIM